MYQDDYKRWMEADLEDADLKPELARIEENDEEIKERFAVALICEECGKCTGSEWNQGSDL